MAQKRSFAVIGLGAFGVAVCDVLTEKGGSVIAIDRAPAVVEQVKGRVSAAVLVDTTDEDSLLKAPLEDIDVAIVAIGDNLEASILTTMLLKQRGVPYVVARAISPLHESARTRSSTSRWRREGASRGDSSPRTCSTPSRSARTSR